MNATGKNIRVAVIALTLSASAFVGIALKEGYSEKAYPDPTYGTKVPTVGFGTTGPDINMSTRLPPVQAVQRALRDTQRFEGAIKRCVKAPLSQAEYDIYVSMTYNIGEAAFCKSGMVRELNAGRYRAACERILDWRFSNKQDCSAPGNRTCRGLWVRRQADHAACVAAVDAAS